MSYQVAYLIVFLGGPLLMLGLTRQAGSESGFVLGAAVVIALIAMALFWRGKPGLETLAMMWLAWIGTISLCVRAVMRRVRKQRALALTKAIGAMATVLPWMGLALADWIKG